MASRRHFGHREAGVCVSLSKGGHLLARRRRGSRPLLLAILLDCPPLVNGGNLVLLSINAKKTLLILEGFCGYPPMNSLEKSGEI